MPGQKESGQMKAWVSGTRVLLHFRFSEKPIQSNGLAIDAASILSLTGVGQIFPATIKIQFQLTQRCRLRFVADSLMRCLRRSIRYTKALDIALPYCYTISMKKIGRPTIPAKDRSSHLIALRLTPAEHKGLERAAEKAGLSLSNYIRTKLNLRGAK